MSHDYDYNGYNGSHFALSLEFIYIFVQVDIQDAVFDADEDNSEGSRSDDEVSAEQDMAFVICFDDKIYY